MMKSVFRERGMPEELVYVALIESGFSPTALSHASAVGYWQFIRDTGKRYNLRIDSHVDERRDPILSTQAAALYLEELFTLFGDWHLALAAYNAGENRIKKAVMKARSRNFWDVAAKRRLLHSETQNYVPKFIAAAFIAQEPEKYGFTEINFQPEFEFESVVIDRSVSLDLLAKELNVPYEDIKKMNPRYKTDFVPIYQDRTNAIRVPVGMKELALTKLELIKADAPRIYVAGFEWYKVKKGDTISGIAKKHRTTMAKLRDLNDWAGRKTFIRAGDKIKVPDTGFAEKPKTDNKSSMSERRPAARAQAPKARSQKQAKRYHVVRKGENLTTIARKYKVNIADITKVNDMTHKATLFTGKKLVIPD
jgi:membrane-bound lytic murein transglycosylase D